MLLEHSIFIEYECFKKPSANVKRTLAFLFCFQDNMLANFDYL